MELTDTQKKRNVDEQVQEEINSAFRTNEGVHQEEHVIPAKDAERNNECEPKRNNTNNVLSIFIAIFVTYSVIVSTIALIVALKNSAQPLSSTTNSCDCAFESFRVDKDPMDSGFCGLVDQCAETFDPTSYPSKRPSSLPTEYHSEHPSVIPSNNPTQIPTANPTTIPSFSPSFEPSVIPSNNPTQIPTANPTKIPSFSPSFEPTQNPITNSPTTDPTSAPTLEPTTEPTLQPSAPPTVFDEYSIGDLKMSLQRQNHGHWALCDGSVLSVDGAYSLLFDVIRFSFGSYNDTNGTMHFQLPNVTDSVLGIGGANHPIGQRIGDEAVELTANQLPKHTHPVVKFQSVGNAVTPHDDKGICMGNYNEPWGYQLRVCDGYGLPDTWSTGYQWQGYGTDPVSMMQPTSFVSNLFIYAGVET